MRSRHHLRLSLGLCLLASPCRAQSTGIEEIIVTGSHVPRQSQQDSPSPLLSISRQDLAALGANEIGDVIETLTINTGSQNNPDAFTQNFTTGTSNVNLRGLGVGSTLILINGRRQTQSAATTDRGENFVDLSSLPPMIAFDRIELLKDGATSLYGSEAVAGVVNFITRAGFEGLDLQLDVQATGAYSQKDRQLSGIYGMSGARTRLLAAFGVLEREPLTTLEHRLSMPADDLSQAGNPGSFLVPTLPGNPVFQPAWTAAFDSNLNAVADFLEPALGLPPVPDAHAPILADQDCSAIAARDPRVIPAIAQAVPSAAGLIPIGLCQFDFGEFWSLVPEERRASAYLELTRELGDRLDGRIELHAADNEARRNNSPSFPFAVFPTVTANHPDNPYGTDVRFIGRIIGAGGAAIESAHDSATRRLVVALAGDFDDAWGWEVGAQYSDNDFLVAAPDVLVDRFNLAIAGFGGSDCNRTLAMPGAGHCRYFNPFGSALLGTGTPNAPELLDELLGFVRLDARSSLLTLEGLIRGELGVLAGGPLGVAAGVQHRADALEYDYDADSNRDNFVFVTGSPDFADDREVAAAFVELALPLSSTVDVQLAARLEDYGDDVDSADPKITALWRPAGTAVSLRGSLGTSFRAPSLFQSFGTQTTLTQLVDPTVGAPQFFPVRTRPNPSGRPLQPEQADVLDLGVSWFAADGLELGLDYWSFEYDDVIIEQNSQAILNAAADGDRQAASQVIRDPASGLLLRVDSFYDNASSLETDGFDLLLTYAFEPSQAGSFRVGAEATYVARYALLDPQAGPVDGAGRRNFANFGTSVPEWRANVPLRWQRGGQAVDVHLRYIGSYLDDQVEFGQGPAFFREIDDHVTVDAQYAYRFRNDFGPLISIGAINLLDQDPPHLATNGGYDSKVHDPRGRVLYAKASVSF